MHLGRLRSSLILGKECKMKLTWIKLFYLLDGNGITVDDENVLWDTLDALLGVNPDDKVDKVEFVE